MLPAIVDFTLVHDREDLAAHLSCTVDVIATATDRPGEVFRELRIPKRSARRQGAHRVVHEVLRDDVKDAYQAFLRRFYDFAREKDPRFPSPHAHGYLPDRSILTNAAEHIGATRILRADIRNFFPSITRGWVERILRDLGLSDGGARELSAFLTIGGALPLGLPSSPLVANLSCIGLDLKLAALAGRYGGKYTRYADDIVISGKGDVPSKIEVATILQEEGFALAEDKFRTKKRGQAFYVTGLSISDEKRPRAAAQLKRRLRQELHCIEVNGLKAHLARRGYQACQATRRVVVVSAPRMLNDLHGAELHGTLERALRRYVRAELLVIDDFAVLAMDGARSSIVIGSTLQSLRTTATNTQPRPLMLNDTSWSELACSMRERDGRRVKSVVSANVEPVCTG
jgi:hypothetical protein